jgi:hypothetical protein
MKESQINTWSERLLSLLGRSMHISSAVFDNDLPIVN